MRRLKLGENQLQIDVCGNVVKESVCERILGVLVNNQFTWHHHLYGDYSNPKKPIPGLVSQLSKRVGMLSRLVHLLPANKFKMLAEGIFFSKLRYCLQLFGNVRGTESMKDSDSRYNAFTKSNLQRLQTLQNKVMRLLTGHSYETPVLTLLKECNMLSINQLIAFSTIMTTFKVRMKNQPHYLAEQLNNPRQTQRNQQNIDVRFRLTTGRQGFMYRAAREWSNLPASLKQQTNLYKFKKGAKQWVVSNIPAIPG